MRNVARGTIAAAVLAGVGLLGACSSQSTAEQPVSPPTSPNPSTPLPEVSSRSPMGLEIRYIDADGMVVVLEPKDFPR